MKPKMIRGIKLLNKIKWHGSFSIKIKPFYLHFDLLQDVAVAGSSHKFIVHFNTLREEESVEVHSMQRSLLCFTKFLISKQVQAAKMFCEGVPKHFTES